MQIAQQTPPSRFIIKDDIAYIFPMAVFLALTQIGVWWPGLYVTSYVAKTFIVPVLVLWLWKRYTKVVWTHVWLGVTIGIIGVVQWVGMEKLILHFLPDYPRLSLQAFDPTQIVSPSARWLFIAVRWAGATLLVPVMEELFWRDFTWRTIVDPFNFKRVLVGKWGWAPFLIVPLLFAMLHVQWLTAIVWALMIGLLLVATKSVGACIIAHSVTNFLLGGYVLYARDWYFW